jgi:hypothetical protein
MATFGHGFFNHIHNTFLSSGAGYGVDYEH